MPEWQKVPWFVVGLCNHRSPPVLFSEADVTVRDRMRNNARNISCRTLTTVIGCARTLGYSPMLSNILDKPASFRASLGHIIQRSDGRTGRHPSAQHPSTIGETPRITRKLSNLSSFSSRRSGAVCASFFRSQVTLLRISGSERLSAHGFLPNRAQRVNHGHLSVSRRCCTDGVCSGRMVGIPRVCREAIHQGGGTPTRIPGYYTHHGAQVVHTHPGNRRTYPPG